MDAQKVFDLALWKSVKISVAESCTGGLLAAALTHIPGSSAIFDRGFISYSNRAKTDMLGVNVETLAQYGAVSEPVAREMATGALVRSDADIALAITGIAGPGPSEHKPEGRVCFAVASAGQHPNSETVEFTAIGRENVRRQSVCHAVELLGRALLQGFPAK